MKILRMILISLFFLSALALLCFFAYRTQIQKTSILSEQEIDQRLMAVQEEMEKYREMIRQYQSRIDQYQNEMTRLNEQINLYAADRNQMRNELDESYAKISELLTAIHSMEKEMVAWQDVTADPATPRILTVNHAFRFAVINQGQLNQIKMGDQFNVERSGRPIAMLQVERLYRSFSAVTILNEVEDSKIRPGDFIQKV